MRAPVDFVLKSFLDKLSKERFQRLVRFLPTNERARIELMGTPQETKPIDLLELVHWSWFIPTLKTYSEKEQLFFLSVLPPLSQESLKQELKITVPLESATHDITSSFFREILLSSLTGSQDRLVPLEYLPASPLKTLLHLPKKELTRLIDYLSLYDLAFELRQIVETKILKRIYSFLSGEERKFLKMVSAHKEHFLHPRIGLDKWEGKKEAFWHLLHKRGLARLGAALSGQDPDLVWYICHQLDIGRGGALFKLCAREELPGVSELVIRQIEEILGNPEIQL